MPILEQDLPSVETVSDHDIYVALPSFLGDLATQAGIGAALFGDSSPRNPFEEGGIGENARVGVLHGIGAKPSYTVAISSTMVFYCRCSAGARKMSRATPAGYARHVRQLKDDDDDDQALGEAGYRRCAGSVWLRCASREGQASGMGQWR